MAASTAAAVRGGSVKLADWLPFFVLGVSSLKNFGPIAAHHQPKPTLCCWYVQQ